MGRYYYCKHTIKQWNSEKDHSFIVRTQNFPKNISYPLGERGKKLEDISNEGARVGGEMIVFGKFSVHTKCNK